MKTNKTFAASVLAAITALIIILIMVIIRSENGMQTIQCELYFLNAEGTSISAETREIKYRDAHELPEIVTELLIKGPDSNRYSKIMSRNTNLLGIQNDDLNNVVINFTSEYLTGDTTKDVQTTYAVVKSLCSLRMINSVKVVVEGNDIPTEDGGTIGYLTSEDINLPTDTYTTEMREIMLYFADKATGMLTIEPRIIKVADQQPIEQYIINELIHGPLGNSVSPTLDKNTTLISVDTEEKICFVNCKPDFIDKNSGNETKENLAVYSIVNSLTELEHIEKVQFLINGKKVENFGNMNIYHAFSRNTFIID